MKHSNRIIGGSGLRSFSAATGIVYVSAALLVVGTSKAEIIYSGIQDIAIPEDFNGVFVNIVTKDRSSSGVSDWDLNPFFGGLGIANSPGFQPVRVGTGDEDPIRSLGWGSLVGGSLSYASGWGGSGAEDDSGHIGPDPSQFTSGVVGYMGFQLIREGTVNYGWMRVCLTQNDHNGRILDWVYGTSGESIVTGSKRDLGSAPLVLAPGTRTTLRSSEAGMGILMAASSEMTFNEGAVGGVFSGRIDGEGDIRISGTGGLRLLGDNEFSGVVSVLEGSLLTVVDRQNLSSSEVRLGSSARLAFDPLSGRSEVANVLTADGSLATIVNNGSGEVVLSGLIHSNGGNLAFSGGPIDVTGNVTGPGSIVKEGEGALTLSGVNTFTGTTKVALGTLIMNGTSISSVTVMGKATLAGTGTISGNVALAGESSAGAMDGGTLAIGGCPGVMTVTGTTVFNAGSIFEWRLDTTQSAPETNRGVAYDGLNVGSLAGGAGVFKVVLSGNSTFGDTFWSQNRSWSDIFKSADGSSNQSLWEPLFQGGVVLVAGDGAVATVEGGFSFSGNTLNYRYSPVPELRSALIVFLMTAGFFRRRRIAWDRPS